MKIKKEDIEKAYKLVKEIPLFLVDSKYTFYFPIERAIENPSTDVNGVVINASKNTIKDQSVEPGLSIIYKDNKKFITLSYVYKNYIIKFDLKEYLKIQGYAIPFNKKEMDYLEGIDAFIIPKESICLNTIYNIDDNK